MLFAHLESAGKTDVGRRRANNEDALVLLEEFGVFCVADGMGGGSSGEVASAKIIEEIRKACHHEEFGGDAIARGQLIFKAINVASAWVFRRARRMNLKVSGSTVVALVFDPDRPGRVIGLHAGDSRIYRLRDDKLEQLMVDHSIEAAAGLDGDGAMPTMFRGIITRAVGVKEQVEIETHSIDAQPGDLFLMCSDGLTNMVPDPKIEMLLARNSNKNLQELADLLVSNANEAGGLDNSTVTLTRVLEADGVDYSLGTTEEDLESFPENSPNNESTMYHTTTTLSAVKAARERAKSGPPEPHKGSPVAEALEEEEGPDNKWQMIFFIAAVSIFALALMLVILGK